MNGAKDLLEVPGLGLSFLLESTAFTVFGVAIQWYAVIITSGIALAWFYATRRSRQFGVHPDTLFDILFVGIVCGIIGARIYFIIFQWDYFAGDILEMLNFRSGGLAIYGGVIGGFLGGFFMCKKKKVPFFPPADVASLGFLIGHIVGRWGNFTNREAFGANTTLPWGMTSDRIRTDLASMKANLGAAGANINPEIPVHPCFLYESLWCLLGFILLHFYSKKRKFDGEILLMYLAWYGLGRFFIEGLRMDSLYIGSFRVSQVLAFALFFGASAVIVWKRVAMSKNETNPPLYVNTAASAHLLAETDQLLTLKKGEKAQAKTDFSKDEAEEIEIDETVAKALLVEEKAERDQADDDQSKPGQADKPD